MSLVSLDPQISGVTEDGHRAGAVRTVPSAGVGVWVPVHPDHYAVELGTGSAASYQPSGIGANEDGSNRGLNLSVPNTLNSGVRVWVPFAGRLFGVRWRRLSSSPPFTVSVDGCAVAVTGTNARLNAEGVTFTSSSDNGLVITHDSIDPSVPHTAEITLVADVGGATRSLLLYGWVLDALAGYRWGGETYYLINSIAVPTTMTAIPLNAGDTASQARGLVRVLYYNTTAGALTVSVQNGAGTVIWAQSIAATSSATFDLGGVTAINPSVQHMASGAGVNATMIGAY